MKLNIIKINPHFQIISSILHVARQKLNMVGILIHTFCSQICPGTFAIINAAHHDVNRIKHGSP